MCDFNYYLEILRNVSLIIVPTLVGYISFKQYNINKLKYDVEHHKLKLELFNKRFDVFDNTLKLYKETMEDKVKQETFNEFNTSYNSSFFLFPNSSGVYDLLDDFHKRFVAIRGYRVPPYKNGSLIMDMDTSKKISEDLNWIRNNIPVLKELLSIHISVP